ncbi:DNA-binding NarL/FixJ family response regulator [Desulfobaculum xiamenense]|uniref:DNA-binding NarL/FixJ family response regulator n=1 Tax=Desulfobaculum xiamenense TaxID=995050 RepID=A0A846QWS5_9BACT|nr:response regulator transcription factor [Desulfobaculum xiamenense]NJB69069.1 DNA-binding NarL/FixJ family response regulator [Desulfobaculum xiamenense]
MGIRVVIADDHKVFLEGLCSLIHEEDDMEVVGQAADGLELLDMVERLRPDVVVTDISMPGLNGLDAAQRIAESHPQVRVVALSMHRDKQFVREMLRNNAKGFLLKECCFDELAEAIRFAMRGELYLSRPLKEFVVQDYVAGLRGPDDAAPCALSGREREVLQMIAEGHSTRDIAEILHISVKTVETYRRQIMTKTNIKTVAGLTKYAIREGLTSV